jgi:hypothetical protein
VNAATMFAGWSDNGSGWSLPAALPFDFNNPPNVAKVLWNRPDESSSPQVMATVPWPGGLAFDAASGTQLARGLCDDLRRDINATLAFWICPTDEGTVAAITGTNKTTFRLHCGSSGSGFEFGDAGELFVDGHQAGDWYLVVMRNDTGANTLTMDALRQRDLAHGSATMPTPVYYGPLTGVDDYLQDGVASAFSIGGPWFSDVAVAAQFDRVGVWDRALTHDEVLQLFNGGAGWLPA